MQKLVVAAIAAVVLVLGAAVPALAIQTQAWEERRIATEEFDAAADAALAASEASELATTALADAREAAEPVLEDARAVAAAAPGYFNAAVLDPLVTAVAALDEAIAAEAADGAAMPGIERPEAIADLRTSVAPLVTWAGSEYERADAASALADELASATAAVGDAVTALAESVEAEASGALAAAPLASAESRAAVDAARDAVTSAIDNVLGKPIADYTAAVAVLRASQQAAVDAAAAVEQVNTGGSTTPDRIRIVPPSCVPDPVRGGCA